MIDKCLSVSFYYYFFFSLTSHLFVCCRSDFNIETKTTVSVTARLWSGSEITGAYWREGRWSFHSPARLLHRGSRSIRRTTTAAEGTPLCCRQTDWDHMSLWIRKTSNTGLQRATHHYVKSKGGGIEALGQDESTLIRKNVSGINYHVLKSRFRSEKKGKCSKIDNIWFKEERGTADRRLKRREKWGHKQGQESSGEKERHQ